MRTRVPSSCLLSSSERLRLSQPVRHAHLPIHRRRGRDVFAGLVALTCAPVELTEAEVAMGDEGAHREFVCQGHSSAIAGLSDSDAYRNLARSNFAQHVHGVGLVPALLVLVRQANRLSRR